jgi:hypothetical protein
MPTKRQDQLDMAINWFAILAEDNPKPGPDGNPQTNAAAWGVPVDKVGALGAQCDKCAALLAKLKDPETATKVARAQCKAAFAQLRKMMQGLHAYFYLDEFPEEELSRLGLLKHDGTYTTHGTPTSQPDTEALMTKNHYEHRVRALNTAGKASKPPDAFGVCFAWQVGGERPAKGEHLPKTKSQRGASYVVIHDEEDKGKTAYYATAYTNDKGDRGKWSPVVDAVIA